jgi:predicted transglutaminase-like cysteine proteinase
MHVVLGSLALASASPAFSECGTATPVARMAKTEAILGGAPSRLAEILARQSASPQAIATAQAEPVRTAAPLAYLRQIAYSATPPLGSLALKPGYGEANRVSLVASPIVRDAAIVQPATFSPPADCALPPKPADPDVSSAAHDEIVGAAPDIFGTVALAIGHTALDAKWQHVSSQHLPAQGPWQAIVDAARSMDRKAQIAFINHWVNTRIQYRDDAASKDQWATAAQALRRGRGDCEDYAVAKLQMLTAAGVPGKDLFFVIVRDLVRRADHAVLGVRVDGRVVILDDMTDRILPSGEISDYRPVLTFSSAGHWTHGYRRLPTVQLASIG